MYLRNYCLMFETGFAGFSDMLDTNFKFEQLPWHCFEGEFAVRGTQ